MEAKNKTIPNLFQQAKDCCGCGACMNACPVQAITMEEDACGFLYPRIDETKCIQCGKCKRVCAFQNDSVKNVPLETYAAVARDRAMAKKSASGGIFAALAKSVLNQAGVVFGAAFQPDWSVAHIAVSDPKDLAALQGSKYTQSDISNTYSQAKNLLEEGKLVLFSGTPCQIHGLYGYLGKDYEKLITVDIICHGVPNHRMLREYISLLEKKHGRKVASFTFRDKDIGWGKNGSVTLCTGKIKKLWESAESYLYYFSNSWIFRENCYHCKYACANRPADLTLGDYWGIEKAHPGYLGAKGWSESEGISVIIVNTEKGKQFLNGMDDVIQRKQSTFAAAAEKNSQLNRPSNPGNREQVLQTYRNGGWEAVQARFEKAVGWRKYTSQIKALIPKEMKRLLKRM